MLFLHLGVGVALRNTWILSLTPAIVIIPRYAVVRREKADREQRFGDQYRHYRSRVRRWL